MFTSERYQRQMIMPEIGVAGQKKMEESAVLVIGCGGLGGVVLQNLIAAGVGTLGIVEPDIVEESNLHRQVLFTPFDVGEPKVEVALRVLKTKNPEVTINPYNERFSVENAYALVKKYDLVVDGSDNFPTRYLVNDACVLMGIPFVTGAIHRFDAQVALLGLQNGPCYRCLYPEPPQAGLVANCVEEGVLGASAGIAGSLMASEVLRYLLALHSSDNAKLVQMDLKDLRFDVLAMGKNPSCPICGSAPEIFDLLDDYDAFCGLEVAAPMVTPAELQEWQSNGEKVFLLDVREPEEFAAGNMGGYLLPSGILTTQLSQLSEYRDERVVVHCKSGGRSREAAKTLLRAGFKDVWDLKGGFLAYLAFRHAFDAFAEEHP